jgi:hypothetical protein
MLLKNAGRMRWKGLHRGWWRRALRLLGLPGAVGVVAEEGVGEGEEGVAPLRGRILPLQVPKTLLVVVVVVVVVVV